MVIGLDIGTTVIKAVAFDDNGRTVEAVSRPSGFRIPRSGWAETGMEVLWESCADTLADLMNELSASGGIAVRALGISGYMGGAWLVDEAMRPVREGILWNDGRAVDIINRWRKEGLIDEIFRISCNAPCPGFMVPVLRWLKEHEPESLAEARHNLFAKDWIRYRLTGEIGTEETDASHVPGDARQRGFSEEILRLCGVQDLAGLLPPVHDSGSIAGRVTPKAAERTGLPAGLPVIPGLADVSAALTGAGALAAGTACSIVGTSCLNNVVTVEPIFDPPGVGLSFLVPGGLWTRTMPNQTGTLAVEWWKKLFAPAGKDGPEIADGFDDEELGRLVEKVPLGAGGVVFHPYLNSTGVLAPVYEPRARGRFWGLGIEHDKYHLLRSIYEGVALSMADCFEHLPRFDGPVRLIGGASRSPVWRRMFADATGCRMQIVRVDEPGALGVAMLAGVAVGVWSDLSEAAAVCCSVGDQIEPDEDRGEKWHRMLRLYQHLRRDLVEEQEIRETVSNV